MTPDLGFGVPLGFVLAFQRLIVSHLPVIVGFGGVSAAGRSSFHHAYRRLILDVLPASTREQTLRSLAALMHIDLPAGAISADHEAAIRSHSLMRRIEPAWFDVDALPSQRRLHARNSELAFRIKRRDLPRHVPAHWTVCDLGNGELAVTVHGQQDFLVDDAAPALVTSAGLLPSGFDPEHLYPSRHHPRALQMTVFGASDALHASGMDLDALRQHVRPDRMAVYASSAHGQLDDYGIGGMMKYPWQGKRTTSKQCPLGFAEMPADFINAYVLGSVGATAGMLGACATFLYNLERAVLDIQAGRIDVAVVGATEAPITPEVIEGYRAMGALGEDAELVALDRHLGRTTVDNTRATRPFGYNVGFTIAESAQFLVLTSDSFALTQGLQIHAAVPGVFIHADGNKKSISAPGVGNYLTMGKAAGLASKIIGESALQSRTYVQAHGTGTPQNRVTESHVFDSIAAAFGIENWLVASVKCYVGHSLGAAAGDQLMAALGAWHDGWIPGIFTLDEIAHDVHRQHLRFSRQHVAEGHEMAAGFINAKGFGGNNATALLLSPVETQNLLRKRHGESKLSDWKHTREATIARAQAYDQQASAGVFNLLYRFGENVVEGHDLGIDKHAVTVPGFAQAVSLDVNNPYADWIA